MRRYEKLSIMAHGGMVCRRERSQKPHLRRKLSLRMKPQLILYQRTKKVKIELDGKRRTAMVYIVNTEGRGGEYRPLNQPGVGYYTTILEGYKTAGFDENILRQATKDSMETENAEYAE
jgi:hypothetical protein